MRFPGPVAEHRLDELHFGNMIPSWGTLSALALARHRPGTTVSPVVDNGTHSWAPESGFALVAETDGCRAALA